MPVPTNNHQVTGDVLPAEDEGHHMDALATVPFPSRPAKATLAAERKKRRKQLDQHQGREDAQKWVESVHPSEIMVFIRRVGEYLSRRRRPWDDLDESFRTLRDQLESWANREKYDADILSGFVHATVKKIDTVVDAVERILKPNTQGFSGNGREGADDASSGAPG